MRLFFATLMAVSPIIASSTLARSEPRSAKDCAAIEESFAYNDCIAKFGPSGTGKIVSHAAGAVLANAPANPAAEGLSDIKLAPSAPSPAARAGSPVARGASPVARAAPSRVSGSILQRRTNGRYFAVFQVGSTAAASRVVPVAPRKPAAVARPTWKPRTAAAAYPRWRQYRRH